MIIFQNSQNLQNQANHQLSQTKILLRKNLLLAIRIGPRRAVIDRKRPVTDPKRAVIGQKKVVTDLRRAVIDLTRVVLDPTKALKMAS